MLNEKKNKNQKHVQTLKIPPPPLREGPNLMFSFTQLLVAFTFEELDLAPLTFELDL